MGFTKTSFTYNDSQVYREKSSGNNNIADWRPVDPANGVVYYARSRITLTTEASLGVKDFSFSVPRQVAGTGGFYWKITPTSQTSWPNDGTLCSRDSSTGALKGSRSNINLAANKSYYLWIWYAYNIGANYGAYGTSITVTGTNPITVGDVTAKVNGADVTTTDMGNAVALSYGASISNGTTYKVKFTYTGTDGNTKTLWLGGSSASTAISESTIDWDTSLDKASIAGNVTDSKTVAGTITVETIYGGSTIGTKSKSLTLTLTEGITAASGWITAAWNNSGAVSGKSGYIQGYSKADLAFDSTKLTIPYSGTLAKWTVKVGSGTAVDKAANASSHTTDTLQSGTTTEITVTAVDSRGFTVSETLTLTMIPYQEPAGSMALFRCIDNGAGATPRYTESDTGPLCAITVQGSCAPLTYNGSSQNSVTIKAYTKIRSDPDTSYEFSAVLPNGSQAAIYQDDQNHTFGDYTYDIKVEITDSLAKTTIITGVLRAAKWGIHFKNDTSDVTAAGIGTAADNPGALTLKDGWNLLSGEELATMATAGENGTTTLPKAGTYLLITNGASAGLCGAWIIGTAAVNIGGGADLTVSVSGTSVTVTGGTCDCTFIRLTA